MSYPGGYVVRVLASTGDYWLGQRVYRSYVSALTVKHNVQDTKRYQRVYIMPATEAQQREALSVGD